MTEQTPEVEYNYRDSAVMKLVLERVTNWDELNADTELEGDEVFKKRLRKSIEELGAAEYDQTGKKSGFFYAPSSLVDGDKPVAVVLKRMTWDRDFPFTREQLFERDQEQTLLCVRFFGPRFIPHTEFFTRENPDGTTEYFIAQDKVGGIQYKKHKDEVVGKGQDIREFTSQVKEEAIAFCRKYIEFFEETGNVVDLDVMIDTKQERLWFFDPSNFRQPYENLPDQLDRFTELFGIQAEVPRSDYENLLSSN